MGKFGKLSSVCLLQLAAMVGLSGIMAETSSAQGAGTIAGTVTVEGTGNVLAGANVFVVGTSRGSLSGTSGGFVIEGVPPGTYEIEFSYVSYRTQRIEVTIAGNQRVTVNAALVLDPLMLDAIVVTGYGAARREELTGSIVAIGSEQLTLLPRATFQDVIQGSPGVLVTSRDGAPGAGFNIRVRGIGSISAGSEPLYVIDGVALYNGSGNNTEIGNGGRTANSLASLNPNDIESLVVLKDAASTAIYGSRGANGVVLITTKGGVSGNTIWASEPRMEFKVQTGISDYAHGNLLKGLTAAQYHDYYVEARILDGMSAADAQIQYDAQWPVTEDNNWLDLMSRNGITQQYDLSATGGSNRFSYFISAGLFDQEGNIREQYFSRLSTRINLTAQLTDNFTLANNLSVAKTEQQGVEDGSAWESAFYMSVFMPPVVPMFDEEGQYYNKHTNVMGANHPMGGLVENTKERTSFRMIDNITGTYRFSDRFAIASAWSFDVYQMHDYLYWNPRYGDGRNSGGSSDDAKSETTTWQATQTATYNDVFWGVHNVDAVAGYEVSKNNRVWNEVWGEGFAHPQLQYPTNAAITEGSAGRNEFAFQSYFTRVNYDYDRTYFLSASYRRDGSSRFGPDERYGNFWSVGAGYNLTHATFMEAISAIDYLKIRGSYGSIGNAAIGNYEWQGLYGFGAAYDNEPGSAPSQVANRILTWESQTAFNIGVDYAILDSRVTGTVEYYRKNSSDLLLDVPTSLTTGFSSTLQNFGDMENWGWEFLVQADLLRTPDYDLNVNFNLTSQNNKITKLGKAFIDGSKRREEGRDFQEYYLYGWAGVNPDNGGALYWTDATKTATTGSASDRFYDGKSATPDLIGSFGLSGRYKSWTLSTQANYVMGHYLYEGAERFYHGDGRYLPRSTSQWAWENRWQNPGDDALFPRQEWGGVSGSQPSNSDRWLHQGDFIRFRNLTLAYRVPESWANSMRLSSLDAHINLNNFYTWVADENLHFDPEQTFSGVYNTGTPNSKTVSFGLTMGF